MRVGVERDLMKKLGRRPLRIRVKRSRGVGPLRGPIAPFRHGDLERHPRGRGVVGDRIDVWVDSRWR